MSDRHAEETGNELVISPDGMVACLCERLRLDWPDLQPFELCKNGAHYYLVVGSSGRVVDLAGLEGQARMKSPMGTPPLHVVDVPPVGAIIVPLGELNAFVELRGTVRNNRDIFVDLSLTLGREFPAFRVEPIDNRVELHFERKLMSGETEVVERALQALGIPIRARIVDPGVLKPEEPFPRMPQGDIDLIPSRALPASVPREVRSLVEEDEDVWLARRAELLLDQTSTRPGDLLPPSWKKLGLICVVNANVFPANNMRSYLTVYDTVVLSLPIEPYFDELLNSMGVTPRALLELLGTGRVKVLLPHSVDRYSAQWLAEASESFPEALIGSRRLACSVIADARKRFPLFCPPTDALDRRGIMLMLRDLAADVKVPEGLRAWVRVLSTELPDIWLLAPREIHREGAMATPRYGMGWIVARLIEELHGTQRTMEIMNASHVVEWAAALGGHAVPVATETYSEEAAVNLVASMCSPVESRSIVTSDCRVHRVVDGLLALDNDVPVVEFATDFKGADVARLRHLINEMAAWNQDDATLESAITRFNREVRRYERHPDRLKTLNLVGLVPAAATAVCMPESLGPWGKFVPLGLWLIGALISTGLEPTAKGPVGGRLLDYANGLLATKTPNAVLVSRVKKQIRGMKS
jgi:hypothetical protein